MQHLTLSLATCLITHLTTMGQVQLVNGSFENDDAPSLDGWEWTCENALLTNIAPVGGGQWSASKEPGHAKGCWPSYLFQRLPDVQSGEILTLSGWMRCNDQLQCAGANLGLGRLNNGMFSMEETAGTMNDTWTFVTITDTVEISDGDTVIVALNAGFTGGPASFSLSHFDLISAALSTGIPAHEQLRPMLYLDHATGWLHIDLRSSLSGPVAIHDLTGKKLNVPTTRNSSTGVMVDLNGMTSGIYFLVAVTDSGRRTVRFSAR